jgi:hypothetical protein
MENGIPFFGGRGIHLSDRRLIVQLREKTLRFPQGDRKAGASILQELRIPFFFYLFFWPEKEGWSYNQEHLFNRKALPIFVKCSLQARLYSL